MMCSCSRWLAAALFVLASVQCCGATKISSHEVSSAYGMVCRATEVLAPTSTEQLAAAIKSYAKLATKQPVHVRATHKYYHSTASFPCAAATAGQHHLPADSSAAMTVDVLMQGMDQLVTADAAAKTITVQAGMTVSSMITIAKQQGLAVPLMAVPNYGGLTIGGIMATAATGTGTAGSPSALCDIVTNIQWVDGKGEVHSSDRSSPEGRAICGGLGVTGVVTQVTLQLQEAGKVLVRTNAHVADTRLMDDIEAVQKATQHVTVTWRPDLGKYTAHMFTPTDLPDPVNATIYQVDRPESDALLLSQALKDWQNDVHSVNQLLNSAMCQIAVPLSSLDIFWAVSKITKKGVNHGLAETNSILSSACHGGPDGSCSFTTVGHIGVGDIHFTIDQSDLRNWIADVKEVINKDLQNAGTSFFNALLGKNKRDCLPPGYFWLRFGNPTDDHVGLNASCPAAAAVAAAAAAANRLRFGNPTNDYVGLDATYHTAGLCWAKLRFGNPTDDYVGLNAAPYKQPVHVQLSLFRNREHGAAPLKNGHVLAFLEQLTLCKYRGRPHFGKNYDRTFTYSKCPIADRHPQWSSWTAAAKQHDPLGLFASPLVATVLRNGSYENYPGCGIDGGCFCETDEHCRHPSQGTSYGWKCLPSKAFPDIKACRPV
ncbi:hypothetical protein OEZ86_009627 [Tetradesmus obliquus]|nr:hypothetical protein OEZ86_009627 [Tetradesmus obliquus]